MSERKEAWREEFIEQWRQVGLKHGLSSRAVNCVGRATHFGLYDRERLEAEQRRWEGRPDYHSLIRLGMANRDMTVWKQLRTEFGQLRTFEQWFCAVADGDVDLKAIRNLGRKTEEEIVRVAISEREMSKRSIEYGYA